MIEIFKKGIIVLLLAFGVTQAQNKMEKDKILLPAEPIENIILNTDRDIYLSGERIWFNAYCLNNKKTIENSLSNILYVELYNASKNAILKQKCKIVNGISSGTIEIPKGFLSDNYYIRAYTQFLRNYPPETYFTTLITVINPSEPYLINSEKTNAPQIEIVPENGFLLNGVSSKVAYRINNDLHLLKSMLIIDDQNNALLKPQPSKNGLGIFEFTPDSSKKYFIKLIFQNNDSILSSLPLVLSEGIAIKTIASNNNIYNRQINSYIILNL